MATKPKDPRPRRYKIPKEASVVNVAEVMKKGDVAILLVASGAREEVGEESRT